MSGHKPRVSIALPVFNGERHLAQALDSILQQTFGDFELLICDNASTDRTPDICRQYAARDPRIRYHRHQRNLGAGPNFNYAFNIASGEYFKWAAHDDLIRAEYIERCVSALDANPHAAVCQSSIETIDDRGYHVSTYDWHTLGLDLPTPSDRLRALWRSPSPLQIYGLIRASALRKTMLFSPYRRADWALLAELTLCGPIVSIREPLFCARRAADRYAVSAFWDGRKAMLWWDTSSAEQRVFHAWRLYAAYVMAIRRHVSDGRERRRCYRALLRTLGSRWNVIWLLIDPILALWPDVLPKIRGIKHRLFGAHSG